MILLAALFCFVSAATAQRHDLGSSPPTAPPPKPIVPPQPVVPAGPNLGALQLVVSNALVSAPQALAVELQTSDDRTRTAALAAIGAPAQYTDHGHIAFPHSVHLDFLPLGDSGVLDAILTVELEQHLLSAILLPEDEQWHRIATVLYPTSFSNSATTPDTFLRTDRSLLQPLRYTAVFHTTTNGSNGDFTDTEVHLRILNGHATVTTSFASNERSCDPAHQRPCDITQRWLQPDATDPAHRFLLVTATGHERPADAGDPIAHSETFEDSHLRTFTCQPFAFSDTSSHFEPVAPPAPCLVPHDAPHDQSHGQPLH
ncbi:MAG: hypothetical protein WBY53_09540 [Acidobacteriaceae bacterium]